MVKPLLFTLSLSLKVPPECEYIYKHQGEASTQHHCKMIGILLSKDLDDIWDECDSNYWPEWMSDTVRKCVPDWKPKK